jgi:hypothetical protein
MAVDTDSRGANLRCTSCTLYARGPAINLTLIFESLESSVGTHSDLYFALRQLENSLTILRIYGSVRFARTAGTRRVLGCGCTTGTQLRP